MMRRTFRRNDGKENGRVLPFSILFPVTDFSSSAIIQKAKQKLSCRWESLPPVHLDSCCIKYDGELAITGAPWGRYYEYKS